MQTRNSERLKFESVYNGAIKVMGVLYPEERLWRGFGSSGMGDAWLFAVEFKPSLYGKAKKKPKQEGTHYLVRSGLAGSGDFAARIPELAPLRSHTVAVFGLGCLGAPSAIEFARANVGELRLFDRDFIDPPTIVRWPIGLSAAGYAKAQVLHTFIGYNYPHTRVTGARVIIGGTRSLDAPAEQDFLAEQLNELSLIYDASAEYGVQRFLAERAAELAIPYVGVQTTAGGWGGLIVRIVPGQTEGCWMCLQLARDPNETDENSRIPSPPADPRGDEIQPAGCANPTFTGANFDTMEVALAGVRVAVSTLISDSSSNHYPGYDWDVAILKLRDETGALLMPTWQTFRLRKHPACPACALRKLIPTVWLYHAALQLMVREAERWLPFETGGVLMGYSDDHHDTFVIEQAIGPGPLAKHSRYSFMPAQYFHEQEIARIYALRKRCSTYLGDWHSHPAGGPFLSKRDRRTLKTIAASPTARMTEPLMVLLVGPPWDPVVWRGSLKRGRFWGHSFTTTACRAIVID